MAHPAIIANKRQVRAGRGTVVSARHWVTEAPLRMLMNNLDPEVAESPDELIVYGGIGRAARDWNAFDRITESLRRLEEDQTLLVQSGKPVGVFPTHADAPRVLIANSNLVPRWATWEHFHELDRKGLMMYGQMTAGSWIYIGSQGIVQGTYETFVEIGRRHFRGSLAGRWILTGGLGGMGGAQPLAATMAGASLLAVECQPSRIEKRLETRYLDRRADSLEQALAIIDEACRAGKAVSVGLLGNAAEVFPELVRRGVGPFRWVALSGDPEDIYRTDAAVKRLLPDNPHLHTWLDMARQRIAFQGLPARICWVGLGDRARLGLAFNAMVASGELKAPIVIGRDHLDSGSVASPNRETEAMRDGPDAVSDWPLLNALLNTASGATWVSLHHGGGVGLGYSQHAGMVIVADGTEDAARRLARVLHNDPASGVMRHADAGYETAIACAAEHGLDLPMLREGE